MTTKPSNYFRIFLYLIIISSFLECQPQPHKYIFPDQNFTNALYDENVDINRDGLFDENEYLNVEKLRLTNKNINDISGIENFKNLKELSINENYITDFSPLQKLKKLQTLAITLNPKISEIDLSENKNLEVLYAVKLGLKNILLNDKIKLLYLGDNEFRYFDASNYPNLESLSLDGCTKLEKVNISNNPKIYQLYFYGTAIKELNISNNKNIKTMYVEKNVKLIKDSDQQAIKASQSVIQN